MLGSSESRRRKKDPDRDRNNPKSKDKERERERDEKKERHRSSKSSRSLRKTTSSTSKDSERDHDRPRERPSKERIRTPSSTSHTPKSSSRMAVVPELDRRGSLGSPNGSRTSLSYPTLSKTHAKENIYSREESVERHKSPFTPEPTDVGDEASGHDKSKDGAPNAPTRAPPSPPLTATSAADLRKTASANSMRRKTAEAIHGEMEGGRRSVDSGTRLTREPRYSASRSSIRGGRGNETVDETDLTSTTVSSQPSTVKQRDPSPNVAASSKRRATSTSAPHPPKTASTTTPLASRPASEVTESTDSNATSVAPDHGAPRRQPAASPTNSEVSPASVVDSSPRTPTQHSVLPSVVSAQKDRPPTVEYFTDPASRPQSIDPDYAPNPLTPPPPPPPPALLEPPRVDYLLQNGGLSRPVPRSLLAAIDNTPVQSYSQYTSPRMAGPQVHDVRNFFRPLQKLLNDYSNVMDNNGSLAVATGYRSVARRLLDRLEAVFARNISSEHCTCIMCADNPLDDREDAAGVNWGEILELVCGRCELPRWPPLDATTPNGLGINLETPCQRIDIDVPEQYHGHFARQSQKTKTAVQSWLSNQQDEAPEEADDETLTFAMLTRIDQAHRPLYYALLYGLDRLPTPRMQFDNSKGTPPAIAKAGLALQRLYRLHSPPRDQLVVVYLMKNPTMHDMLATLSAVTKHEWEILVSGRFDGFLWSGAEDIPDLRSPPSRGPSRGPSYTQPSGTSNGSTGGVPVHTPYQYASQTTGTTTTFPPSSGTSSRPVSVRPGSTRPGNGPAPVQLDEDTEVAVLAEVEREIYLAMEAMEDAFENLHNSAEIVRRRLRERGAALAMVAQARRGSAMGGIEVRTDTPASFRGPDVDDNLEDLRSEIGPDDSASNVSHNRRGRGHRKARRTPAPVEEESEEEPSLAERVRRRF